MKYLQSIYILKFCYESLFKKETPEIEKMVLAVFFVKPKCIEWCYNSEPDKRTVG